MLVATDGNTSSPHTIVFSFDFSTTPDAKLPDAGTYKIVSSATGAGQVSFSANGASASQVYSFTGNDNISATVSVLGDKVRIQMPKAWAIDGEDSMQVSADIIQR